jgi:hypothetical protein
MSTKESKINPLRELLEQKAEFLNEVAENESYARIFNELGIERTPKVIEENLISIEAFNEYENLQFEAGYLYGLNCGIRLLEMKGDKNV